MAKIPQCLLSFVVYFSAAALPLNADAPLRVHYTGPGGAVLTALTLAPSFTVTPDIRDADVYVCDGTVSDAALVRERVTAGAGLVLVMGPDFDRAALAALTGCAGQPVPREDPVSVDTAGGGHPVTRDIVWGGSPQVRERTRVSCAGFETIAAEHNAGEPLLSAARSGKGMIFLITAHLDDARNPAFRQWAYFNYFVYDLVTRAAGKEPLSFADFPASPVPHRDERIALLAILLSLNFIAVFAFMAVRRYSRGHPEALARIVADRRLYAERETSTDWNAIGFHRPLGGFMFAFMFGIMLFIPLIVYQNLVLPTWILPSAQALGLWGRVTQFFGVAWLFFDMGTSTAFIKFLSEHRVDDPGRGIKFGQLFVWWQLISGTIQVTLIIALTAFMMPESAYAIYTWSVIIHTLIQVPGFYQVMRHALTGLQRFDYAQMLDLALAIVLPIIVQPVIVTVMYRWGAANPGFGASMGGLLGMGIAAYAAEALVFAAGLLLYRRLGYNARVLFLAHFDREIVKTGLMFGLFEMLGSIAWAGGQALEIWITQDRLLNYAEVWGNWVIAQNFVFAYMVLWTLFNNLMPAISEAVSHGRRALGQYYTVQAYRYGGLISGYLCAVLLAVADRFILGASGPEFERAALYAFPLIVWGAIQYPSWVGDTVQLAANRPYLKSALVAFEQVVRVVLAYFLVGAWQIHGLILAYFIGLLIKDIAGYFINHRLCFPQRFYAWQSLAAPVLSAGCHFLVIRAVGGLIWNGDQATSVLIFFIGILPSYPLYAFLTGIFGGWDDGSLEELRRAVPLSSFMHRFTMLFYTAARAGARMSPLHNRFAVGIRRRAIEEADSLTGERVAL